MSLSWIDFLTIVDEPLETLMTLGECITLSWKRLPRFFVQISLKETRSLFYRYKKIKNIVSAVLLARICGKTCMTAAQIQFK